MTGYDVIILGATAFGVSLAQKLSDEGISALVIERSIVCGGEFGGCFYSCRADASLSDSPLYKELDRRSLIGEDGVIHTLPLDGIFSGMLEKSGADVLLSCEIVSAREDEDGITLEIFDEDGGGELRCHRLIDTTSEDFARFGGCERFLCASLVNGRNTLTYDPAEYDGGAELTPGDRPDLGFSIDRGRFSGEYYLRLRLSETDDYREARRALTEKWDEHYKSFKPFEIASVAPFIQYRFPENALFVHGRYLCRPSAAFGDPVSAFEGGKKEW